MRQQHFLAQTDGRAVARYATLRAKVEIRALVADLVAGNYRAIEADGRIGRLTRDELERAIAEYGGTLAIPPPNAIDNAYIYPSEIRPSELYIDFPLWTAEEGESDLTLILTVVEAEDRAFVTIDDVRVP